MRDLAPPSFLKAVFVIARRDVMATVLSKGFLIWLAMPFVGILFGLGAAIAQGGGDAPERTPVSVAVIDSTDDFATWLTDTAMLERVRAKHGALRQQYEDKYPDAPLPDALAERSEILSEAELTAYDEAGTLDEVEARHDLKPSRVLTALRGERREPALTRLNAADDIEAQAARLLRPGNNRFGAVLLSDDTGIRILRQSDDASVTRLRQLASRAADRRAFQAEGIAATLETIRLDSPDIPVDTVKREGVPAAASKKAEEAGPLATGATMVLFVLISLLAGALLSNMVEEKGNKVIEILVASVPIPAIFAGKLIGMLIVSLIGVTVWGIMFGGGGAFLLSQLPADVLADPARGWPQFIALVFAYFVAAYLIYGAVYLGIGSLCTSIREVQTLSMPVTILQMVILILTLGAIANPGGTGATIASWFPLSAPYMMAARASMGTDIGIHIAALVWQLAFAGLIIFVASRLFRYGVLRSGPPPSLKQLGKSMKFWARGEMG
ncbi:MAG: ABC transporter permease [Pacificimonas sp.]